MRFGIRLISKYTGERITLGTQYDSEEEVIKAAEVVVCRRCNTWEIVYIPEESEWVNKEIGFVKQKGIKNEMQ
jgi:hypothetical protein